MKGIILAGGSGTRLYPITRAVNKQLLPIYNKPMIYYPLSVLMLSGIREVLIISNRQTLPLLRNLFGDGSQLGIEISYAEQAHPNGLPEAFLLCPEYIQNQNVCLILGDNIIFGTGLSLRLQKLVREHTGATIFAYPVRNPEKYGVVELDVNNIVLSIEEKPDNPKTNYAIPGLYFFDEDVVKYAQELLPSARGELEITDLIKRYWRENKLHVEILNRGHAWLDMGSHETLLQASMFVEAIENRQGMMIGCLEEIAYRMHYIDLGRLEMLGKTINNDYGKYILDLVKEFTEK